MKIGVCKRYGKKRAQFLPYALPLIEQEEIDEVIGTLKSGWLSTGPKVRQFEEEFRHCRCKTCDRCQFMYGRFIFSLKG